jgi:hypothetical protein
MVYWEHDMNNYSIQLTQQQLSIIDAALQEMPHRLAAPLIQDINRQLTESQKVQVGDDIPDNTGWNPIA